MLNNFLVTTYVAPNIAVIVDPPVIDGNAMEDAINLTCTATVEQSITSDQYQLVWMLNGAPVEPSERVMVCMCCLCCDYHSLENIHSR